MVAAAAAIGQGRAARTTARRSTICATIIATRRTALARPSAWPIRSPPCGRNARHGGTQTEREKLGESDLLDDGCHGDEAVGAEDPIADKHPERHRRQRKSSHRDLQGRREAGVPPERRALRKASGAPGAITINATPICSARPRPNAKPAMKPITGTTTGTLTRPRISSRRRTKMREQQARRDGGADGCHHREYGRERQRVDQP